MWVERDVDHSDVPLGNEVSQILAQLRNGGVDEDGGQEAYGQLNAILKVSCPFRRAWK